MLGTGRLASGSETVAALVTGAGLKVALPLFCDAAVHVDHRCGDLGVPAG